MQVSLSFQARSITDPLLYFTADMSCFSSFHLANISYDESQKNDFVLLCYCFGGHVGRPCLVASGSPAPPPVTLLRLAAFAALQSEYLLGWQTPLSQQMVLLGKPTVAMRLDLPERLLNAAPLQNTRGWRRRKRLKVQLHRLAQKPSDIRVLMTHIHL